MSINIQSDYTTVGCFPLLLFFEPSTLGKRGKIAEKYTKNIPKKPKIQVFLPKNWGKNGGGIFILKNTLDYRPKKSKKLPISRCDLKKKSILGGAFFLEMGAGIFPTRPILY